jgi:hypothetical protein
MGNDMGRTHILERKQMHTGFSCKNLKEGGIEDRINLVLDSEKWWAVLNTVMFL